MVIISRPQNGWITVVRYSAQPEPTKQSPMQKPFVLQDQGFASGYHHHFSNGDTTILHYAIDIFNVFNNAFSDDLTITSHFSHKWYSWFKSKAWILFVSQNLVCQVLNLCSGDSFAPVRHNIDLDECGTDRYDFTKFVVNYHKWVLICWHCYIADTHFYTHNINIWRTTKRKSFSNNNIIVRILDI